MKKLGMFVLTGVATICMFFTGCSSHSNNDDSTTNNDKEILVISFGTSYNDSRDVTIGAIENAIADKFGDYTVKRAFTSQIIIDKIAERDKIVIDNVEQALERAANDKVKTLIVQPTHLMHGYEYTDILNAVEKYKDKFETLVLGKPLLNEDTDFESVINAITKATSVYDDGQTAICFMGHGTEADSNEVYSKLQSMIKDRGYENYFIGTVEAEPTLEYVIENVGKGNYKRVVIEPLMVVAGDHANNDMAGDEEDSWKTQFEKAGYEVECIIHGLGEIEEIRDIYVEHTQAAIDSVK